MPSLEDMTFQQLCTHAKENGVSESKADLAMDRTDLLSMIHLAALLTPAAPEEPVEIPSCEVLETR